MPATRVAYVFQCARCPFVPRPGSFDAQMSRMLEHLLIRHSEIPRVLISDHDTSTDTLYFSLIAPGRSRARTAFVVRRLSMNPARRRRR